jgi:hypothetical protein
MKSHLLWHAALSCFFVALAFCAWKYPTGWDEEALVYVLDAQHKLLSEVDYITPEQRVVVKQKGTNLFVSIQSPQTPNPLEYPAVEHLQDTWEQLLPLKATRALGVVSAEHLKAFGLESPQVQLLIKTQKDSYTLALGGNTYGSGDVYVQRQDKHVFLLKSGVINPFRFSPASLQDKTLVKINAADVERVSVVRKGHTEEYIHRFAENAEKAFFAKASMPQVPDEKATAWIRQAMALRMEHLKARLPRTQPALEVSFMSSEGAVEKIRVWAPQGDIAWASSMRFPYGVEIHPRVYAMLMDDR